MKQIRLLPVVIVAALALLLFKGIGLVTNGGYVLSGASFAVAAEHGASGGGGEHAAAGSDATLSLPEEPTLEDTSPTLEDDAVTLPIGGEAAAGGHGEAAAGGHGESAAGDHETAAEGGEAAADAEHGTTAEAGHEAPAGDAGGEHGAEATPAEAAAETQAAVAGPLGVCPPEDLSTAVAEGGDHGAPAAAATHEENCVPIPRNAAGDAIPLIKDDSGHMVPLTAEGGSEEALIARLNERREQLDSRESELDMRMALVEAAEKRIEERTATLEALEARINAMVDEKRTLEEAQFTAVVATYETMKPKDAAKIFDELDMSVLLRVARAINPRKLAPIMAKMDPLKAKDLTAGLAVDQVEPTIDIANEDLSALPQIVGQ